MMEDHLIEKNNDLNSMSADDGESSDLDDGGSFDTEENEDKYKPYSDFLGLRQRPTPLRSELAARYKDIQDILLSEGFAEMKSMSDDDLKIQDLISRFKYDDYLDEVSQMISPPTVIAEARSDCNLNLGTARHTEQRITPSSLLLMNTPRRIDIQEGSSNDEELHGKRKKMDFEWIFVITNIVLESMSAIFTQLSSKQKPKYALFGMLLSYFALLTCIIELIYEGRRHQKIPIWRRRRSTWHYDRPQRRKAFATLNNIIALACALGQCVVTTINYRLDNPIKVTVLPIILAYGVLFSKTLKYRQREAL